MSSSWKWTAKSKELTRAQLQPYIQGPDPDLRARAYQELYRVYGEDGPVLGQMYQTRARDWHNENITMRKFSSPIAVRNLANDVPDEAVNVLMDVTKKNSKIFQRYFKMKAKHVGSLRASCAAMTFMHLSQSQTKTFEFGDAARMVLESFSAFEPQVGELAQRVFDQDHLDSEVRKGKQGGAFCASINPENTPYVLMNYTGRAPRCGHAGARARACHPCHAGVASQHASPSIHPCRWQKPPPRSAK